jgi:hypothetical protein
MSACLDDIQLGAMNCAGRTRADTQLLPYDDNAVEEAFPGKKVGITPTLLGASPMDW